MENIQIKYQQKFYNIIEFSKYWLNYLEFKEELYYTKDSYSPRLSILGNCNVNDPNYTHEERAISFAKMQSSPFKADILEVTIRVLDTFNNEQLISIGGFTDEAVLNMYYYILNTLKNE